jgi:hypothetical protein
MLKKIIIVFFVLFAALPTNAQVLTVTPDSLWFGATAVGTTSAAQTSVLTGSFLTPASGVLTVVSPTSFAVNNGSSWVNSYTISYSGGVLASTSISIIFAPSAGVAYWGYLHITGGGTRDTVVINGTGISGCTGTPTGGTALATPSVGGIADTFYLNCSGYSASAGLSFQWKDSSAATSGSWVNISGATSPSYSFIGITRNTFYKCAVTCTTSGRSAFSTIDTINALPVAATCTPAPSSAAASCSTYTMSFNSVFLRGLSDSITDVLACDGSGYRDRTSLSCTMAQACTYLMSVSTGGGSTSVTNSCQWWIDFNNNGSFEASESVGGSSSAFTSTSFGLNIPSTVPMGLFRMRGVSSYYAYHAYPAIDPCMTSYVYGEARDYYVQIVARPSFSATSSISFPITLAGTTSSPLPFTFSSSYLSPATGTVTVSAPANYLVCATSSGTFASSYTVTYTGGVLPATTGYAVFAAPSGTGPYSGCITLSGGSTAGSACVSVSGISAAACTGLPAPGTISSSVSSAGATTAITLTNSGYSATVGISFQWQSATAGTWTNISGATNATYSFTGISTTTSYRCKVTCSYSSLTDSTNVISILLNCTGTPAGGHVYSPFTSCTGCTDTLRLSGVPAVGGLLYQWQQSTTGTSSWTNISGETLSSYRYTAYSEKYYRCLVRCTFAGGTAFSDTFHRTFNARILAHTVTDSLTSVCYGPLFHITANSNGTGLFLKTNYGDATSDSVHMAGTTTSVTNNFHLYASPGTYSVRHILYNNNIPQDSVSYSYTYTQCKVLPIKFFTDIDGSGSYSSGDRLNMATVATEVDSNGIPVDTISATSGFYYRAFGPAGTVYTFRPYGLAGGYILTVPSSGVLHDTITSSTSAYPAKYFGMVCSSSSSVDLETYMVVVSTRPDGQSGYVYVRNNTCSTPAATLKLNYSTDYTNMPTVPRASSVAVGTVTWNISSTPSVGSSPLSYSWRASVPPTGLTPGDTVNSRLLVTPTAGDMDTTNNVVVRVDTVRGSYDPNHIWVKPEGCIASGAVPVQLQYTVNFENVGNAPAHNIHVLDTLPDYVDPSTIEIEMASHEMYLYSYKDAGHTVLKFDFPGIELADTSHHGLSDGAFIFNIKTRGGLANGTAIRNRVGIYFDYNDVVLTNQVNNEIGCPVVVAVREAAINGGDFILYPNPATSELQIRMADEKAELIIVNQVGQVCQRQQLTDKSSKVDINQLAPGIYYVKLTTETGVSVKQFVKK